MTRKTAKLGGTASDIVVGKVAVSHIILDAMKYIHLHLFFSHALSMGCCQ
jgi:hypothetical protein